MSRNGSGVYSLPAGSTAVTGDVAAASVHNTPLTDLETDMNTARPVVAGGTGATSRTAARQNLYIDGNYITTAVDYIPLSPDRSKVIRGTAALTLNLTAAATLADGWFIDVIADGGIVTVDPNGAELIDGATTITIADGNQARIVCTGTAFYSMFQAPPAGASIANVVEDTTPQLGGSLDGQGNDITKLGTLSLTEQAAANADVAGDGQLWVKTATPNELWFTDDTGTDVQLGASSGGGWTSVSVTEPTSDVASIIVTGLSGYRKVRMTWLAGCTTSGSSNPIQVFVRAAAGTWRVMGQGYASFGSDSLLGTVIIDNFDNSQGGNLRIAAGFEGQPNNAIGVIDRSSNSTYLSNTGFKNILGYSSYTETLDEVKIQFTVGNIQGATADKRSWLMVEGHA